MKQFKNILMYAGWGDSKVAISRSVELALENDARLTLIDVIKPIPHAIGVMTDVATPEELQRLVVEEHREKLLELAAEYSDTGVALDVVVRVGKPSVEMVREVIEGKHDLLVKTADGHKTLKHLFGSTAKSVMRTCPCPVWAFKPEMHGTFDQIVVAIDVDAQDEEHAALNRQLLELSHAIAQTDDASLHLVAAYEVWMEQSLRRRAGDAEIDHIRRIRLQRVKSAIDELLKQEGLPDKGIPQEKVHVHVHSGTPDRVISKVAEEVEADLLVMGTVCRTGVAGFLIGNTAEQVLSEATCSVLALKPEGFVTPIKLSDEES